MPKEPSHPFTVISRFTVRSGHADQVAEAFRARPHLVDSERGFRGLDALRCSEDPDEFWLITRWDDEPSYRRWYASHKYQESHQGIPGGLKLVPGSVVVRTFEHVSA